MSTSFCGVNKIVSRIGITPVGSSKYRVNRLRFHLLAYVIARKAKLLGKESKFFIRCDDTNSSNVNRNFLDSYLEVLTSLGVIPDLTPYDKVDNEFSLFQSERGDLYKMFVDQLIEKDLVFNDSSGALFFSPEEFSKQFRHSLYNDKLLVVDASMGDLSVNIQSPLMERKGKMGFVPFALMRSNGEYLFNLCSPVDDAMLGVTHVVRDCDKLNLLSKQEMIRISLGFSPLTYVHVPLLVDKSNKRFVHDEYWGDATFQDFISRGILPEALVSYLLSGFFGPSERYYSSLDEFAVQVDFSQLHRSNTVFTEAVLKQHNKKAVEKSTEKAYVAGLRKYLAFHDCGALKSFDSDPQLLKVIVRMKKEFSESRVIIGYLSTPKYDVMDIDNVYTLNLVHDFLMRKVLDDKHVSVKSMLEMSASNAKHLGISKKEFYQSIRYLLTGKYQGCDLHEIVQYLEKTDLIMMRLDIARKELFKTNILNKCQNLQNGD